MKKRKVQKLMLNRETLHRLEPSLLHHAGGLIETGGSDCVTRCASNCCPNEGGTGTDGSICATCYECSNGCATGGACTVSCP